MIHSATFSYPAALATLTASKSPASFAAVILKLDPDIIENMLRCKFGKHDA